MLQLLIFEIFGLMQLHSMENNHVISFHSDKLAIYLVFFLKKQPVPKEYVILCTTFFSQI